LTDLGLVDEYRLYFRPVVPGRGKPFCRLNGRENNNRIV
jgi:riboflavin biosynthesis pyrimidine reductase